MMSKYPFRTGEQIWAIYQELAAQGDSKKPYILEYTANPKQTLYYCGANHSNNSNNSQYEILLEHWNKFIQHTNTKKIVMKDRKINSLSASS